MQGLAEKKEIIHRLRKELLELQHFIKPPDHCDMGLGVMEKAFPAQTFPTGAIHEFVSQAHDTAAATNGFMTALLGRLMGKNKRCVWISTRRAAYPPALTLFGIVPHNIIFIDLAKQKEALWATEEALKCTALAAVVAELDEMDFTASRRLQLITEQSRVTGFIHCCNPKNHNSTASVCRWKITPLPSLTDEGMPGIGLPRWQVQLVKVRNGKPGAWKLEWFEKRFRPIAKEIILEVPHLKTAAYV